MPPNPYIQNRDAIACYTLGPRFWYMDAIFFLKIHLYVAPVGLKKIVT